MSRRDLSLYLNAWIFEFLHYAYITSAFKSIYDVFFLKKSFKCHLSEICLARYEIHGLRRCVYHASLWIPNICHNACPKWLGPQRNRGKMKNHLVLVILHGAELYNCLARLSNYFLKCYSLAWHEVMVEMKFLLKIEK